MAKFIDDIDNDEIRIIGKQVPNREQEEVSAPKKRKRWPYWLIIALIAAGITTILLLWLNRQNTSKQPVTPNETQGQAAEEQPYTEIFDTIVNGIPLKVFYPRNAKPHLTLMPVNIEDTTVILGAQAADYGWDRNKWIIAGGFILKGELLSYSKSKYGFCALLDSGVVIGKALSTPYFERCVEEGGDFFRQYPLVYENEPQVYKSNGQFPRRALCQTDDRVFIVETPTAETLNAFAQALADMSIKNAIALVSTGMAWRWATDRNGKRYVIGVTETEPPPMANFIVWTKD